MNNFFTRRAMAAATLLATLAAAVALPGCGGGGSDDGGGTGRVRLVNATTDYAALDFYANDALQTKDTASFTAGAYSPEIGAGAVTMALKRSGSASTAVSVSRTVAKDGNHTLVAYSTETSLRAMYMNDAESAPAAGQAKLRLFNGAVEAGTLDLYVFPADANLADQGAAFSGALTDTLSAYKEFVKGAWRIVVTGAGNKADVRLDLPSVALADQQIVTLVVTATPGGVLVHGLLLNQRGDVVAKKNPTARVRVVAGVSAGGAVSVLANGVTLSSGITSPAIVPYTTMPAGAVTGELRVNGGAALALPAFTAVPGADVTLMVLGTPAAPSAFVLQDNNKPAAAGNAKLRLVHGVNGLGGNATLTADYGLVASDIPFGQASVSTSLVVGNPVRLEVTSPAAAARLFLADEANLQPTKVYTVFMLGDAAAPVGTLVRDR